MSSAFFLTSLKIFVIIYIRNNMQGDELYEICGSLL